MGGLSGILGTAGGASGSGYAAPTNANIQPSVNQNQLNASYAGTQGSLSAQQKLLDALNAQNGLGTQTGAYNQQQTLANQLQANNLPGYQGSALQQQQALNSQLAASNGVGNLNSAINNQMNLARQQQGTLGQYQNLANGVGPNPAQAALNQNTAQNVANQSAMMAGQRGAASNVGLLARQAAQQGANTQQQAVGQGATLQAQQQIAGLSGLSAQQQAIGNTNSNIGSMAGQQIGALQTGTNAQQQAASNAIAQQQAQQAALANQANTMAGQQIGATGANTQANLANQQQFQNALAGQNSANVSSQNNVNAGNTQMANTSLQGQQGIVGGIMNSLGGAFHGAFAKGGEVSKHYDMGGSVTPDAGISSGPMSSFGQAIANSSAPSSSDTDAMFNLAGNNPGAQALQKGFGSFGKSKSPSMPGGGGMPGAGAADAGAGGASSGGLEGILAEAGPAVMLAAKGGPAKRHDYRVGGNVKAATSKEKAVKSGNSYDNDKIPAMLSEGEVVIPRSVMQGKDPARGAADFVAKVLAKRRRA